MTDNTGVAPLRAKNGITYSDSDMKVNTLNEQFVSVFNTDEDILTAPDMGSSPHPAMHQIEVSQEGIFNLLNGFQVHKATGPDELPGELLKSGRGADTDPYPLLSSLSGSGNCTRRLEICQCGANIQERRQKQA